MLDLPAILTAIRERPDDGPRWHPLTGWLADNGRDDEAAAVRVFWPTLRDTVTVAGVSVEQTLREVARHAGRLGRRARAIEARRWDGLPNEQPSAGRARRGLTRRRVRVSPRACDPVFASDQGDDGQSITPARR